MSGSAASSENTVPNVISHTVRGRRYECRADENGFVLVDQTSSGTPYETDISQYLPLVTPKLTKAGKIAARQPCVQTKPLAWWRTQCAFRGLPTSGTIAKLQQEIRSHGDKGLSPTIKQQFEKMKQDNDQQIWNQLDDSGKASAQPRRFLEETMGTNGSRRDEVLVVKVGNWADSITAAARLLGLECEADKMPGFETGERLVVVGIDALRVRAVFAEHKRQSQYTCRTLDQEPRTSERKIRPVTKNKSRTPKLKEKKTKVDWDVKGRWKISCPYIEEQWGDGDQTLSLTLGYTEPGRDGAVQIYADFDFIVLTGIMRFVDKDGETASQFHLRKSCLPSSDCQTFNFRWRGEETGEGEIQLGSDSELCSLIFESPNVLNGIFKGGFLGKQNFTGLKTSTRVTQRDPELLWSQRSDSAYEQARTNRWR